MRHVGSKIFAEYEEFVEKFTTLEKVISYDLKTNGFRQEVACTQSRCCFADPKESSLRFKRLSMECVLN